MKRLILVIISFSFTLTLFSQTKKFSRWSITGEYGVTYYFGDLPPQLSKIIPTSLQGAVCGATVEYSMSPVWGLSLDYLHLPFSGKNKIAYFETNLSNVDLNATINFTKMIFPQTKSKFSFNGTIGLGLATFSSKYKYPDPSESASFINTKTNYVTSVPVSFLFEYNLFKFLAVGARVNYLAYFSDNLEGVPYLNFKGVTNDYVSMVSMSLRYKIIARNKPHLRNVNSEDFIVNNNSDFSSDNSISEPEVQSKDSCNACEALKLIRTDGVIITKIEKSNKVLRKQLDSVLVILSKSNLDSDGDGVFDNIDKCPKTPPEVRGLVDKNGCTLDTDGDCIPDYRDNCPNIAGTVANKGCPEVKKEVKALFNQALQGIQFETGIADLKSVSTLILDKIADILILNPSYLIEIQGHTDNVGKSDANLLLSENRVESVRQYLIEKGVNEKRFTAHGYGDTKPIADNDTPEGRTKNRRVEFVVSFEK